MKFPSKSKSRKPHKFLIIMKSKISFIERKIQHKDE